VPSPRIHVANRIAQARELAGLDTTGLAQALGLSIAAYVDLEAYDDEAYMSVSLAQLRSLGKLLNICPRNLFASDAVDSNPEELRPSELVSRIRDYLRTHALSIEQFEAQVGWTVSPVMSNPDTLWQAWNVDALYDVCEPLGVVWQMVLPKCAA
jgi:transcriptional regulator with XRE-family HTH domain